MCIMNSFSIRRHLGYKQEVFRTFLLPFISAFWMGLVTAGVYYGLDSGILLLSETADIVISDMIRNIICLIPSLLIAVFIYFALVIKLGAISKKDLKTMPKGHVLLRIAKKMHLIR